MPAANVQRLADRLRDAAARLERGEVAQVVLVVKQESGSYAIEHLCMPFGEESYLARSSSGTAQAVENLLHGFQPEVRALWWPEGSRHPVRLLKRLD
ncbi:MAG: hypothetical protein ACOZHQ_14035 [Thermodesulfobacteriota bacterium]